ncbi:hypothetical protein QIY60_23045 [Streptomyces sp. BPTC-684]|nr:hypothetical protein [Streptomyces sp. BPTC-684]WHM39423.1 hypothetical protein QIY60_23045 [Streptomyces sp. BPTC-684]
MHAYEPSRQPYQSQIPSMRPAQDFSGGHSATPIYDALYSEYRRSFRALPGDRSNEDDLGFRGFAALGHSGSLGFRGAHQHHAQPVHPQVPHPQTVPSFHPYPAHSGAPWQLSGAASGGGGTGQTTGRQHTGLHQLPAALPPAPRRGL